MYYIMPPKKRKSKDNKIVNVHGMINFYELPKVKKFLPTSINPNYNKHHIKVPFRGLLIGSSGSGKTNLFCNILEQFRDTFNHLYVYTQAPEPLYDFLNSQLDSDVFTIKYGLQAYRDFKEADFYGQSLVIFDDMVNEKDQSCINNLYIRGRKIGVSMLYLTQSYFEVPKMIRLQCQYVFVVKVSGVRDLRLILSEYALTATKSQLQNMYNYCCNQNIFGDVFTIDLNAPQDKSFRLNFDTYLNISDF